MITPEFAGRRLDTALSMFGKFLSLLVYAGMVSEFNSRQDASESEKLTRIILLPLYLIVVAGYMWRDDMRLVGHLPYGIFKGCVRAFKRDNEAVQEKQSDLVVDNPGLEESEGENAAEYARGASFDSDRENQDDRDDYGRNEGADSSDKSYTETPHTPHTVLTASQYDRKRSSHDSDSDSESLT